MTKKIQWIRNLAQIIFLGIFIAGFYRDLRVVLTVLLPAAILFGNFFCGWICPFGTMQEFFGAIGARIFKKRCTMPKSIQKYLQFSRYVLMIIMMSGIVSLSFNYINGYKTFLMMDLSDLILSASIIIMLSFLFISLIFERPFCNYLCTEAVKYGVISLPRIFTIKREEGSCISCKKCDKACPMNITISRRNHVRSGQCINCFECTSACPAENALRYGLTKYSFRNKKSK